MADCVICGSKAKGKRAGLDYCKTCIINFDTRLQRFVEAKNNDDIEKYYALAIRTIENKDTFSSISDKEKVLAHFKKEYEDKIQEMKTMEQKRNAKNLLYEVQGVRGRYLEVYSNKVVIYVRPNLGSFATSNLTDGKKTIYFKDIIGLQYKPSNALIGYLQFETASSIMNNLDSNFYNENTFTFDEVTTTNKLILEIEEYINKQLEKIKQQQNIISHADEIRKFKELLDENIISQEEFDNVKQRLLNF